MILAALSGVPRLQNFHSSLAARVLEERLVDVEGIQLTAPESVYRHAPLAPPTRPTGPRGRPRRPRARPVGRTSRTQIQVSPRLRNRARLAACPVTTAAASGTSVTRLRPFRMPLRPDPHDPEHSDGHHERPSNEEGGFFRCGHEGHALLVSLRRLVRVDLARSGHGQKSRRTFAIGGKSGKRLRPTYRLYASMEKPVVWSLVVTWALTLGPARAGTTPTPGCRLLPRRSPPEGSPALALRGR